MATLMLFDRNNTHIDPEKDQRGCWKRGYVVQVFEDTQPLVLPPQPPFVFVKITGITKAQAEKYIQMEYDTTDPDNPILVRRRAFKVLVDNVPNQIRDKIINDRYVEVSFQQVRNYIQNIRTRATE